MKKWIKYLLPAIIVLLLAILCIKSCSLYDKYSVLKGRYDALDEEYDKYKRDSLREVSQLRDIIAQKDALISKINEEVEEKYSEIEELHGISEELEDAYTKLTDHVAQVDNLQRQVNIWKNKFSLAESIIKSKDEIIFNMNQKYVAQLDISNRYKKLYENEATLRKLAEQRLTLADKKLKGLRFQLNLGKGVVIVLGAVMIWGVVS